MIHHFLKMFLRASLKNASYSLISILGLVIGLAACALISLYVWNERSYDDFHSKKEQIFRVRHDRFTNGELNRQWAAGPMGIGPDLKNNFPEVNRFVRLNRGVNEHKVLTNGDVLFKEGRIFYASEDFFKLFSFPLLKGADSLVLRDPFTMVVSESFAKKYFGEQDVVGKILKCDGKQEYVITGVFKDVPENTHLKFDALFSFESLLKILGPKETEELMTNWGWEGNYTYVELNSSTSAAALQAKLPAFVEKKMGNTLREWNEWMEFTLQPLSSIHLYSIAPDELEAGGDGKSINFLGVIAAFILIMAWINYVNLATARSMERAKEVGIRKVLGSGRSQLIKQFLFESFIIKLIALCITAVLVVLLLPSFSDMVDRTIDLAVFGMTRVWVLIIFIFVLGVIGSGLYPALVMSGFMPVSVLKGRFQNSLKGIYLRKGLVTVQFVSCIVLIIGAFAVYSQIQFMRKSSSGVDMEQIVVINGPTATDSTYSSRLKTLCQSLLQYSDVKDVTVSTDVPGHHIRNSNGNARLVGQDVKEGNMYQAIMTDENFIRTYGLSLMEGRNFSGNLKDQWRTAIVNETAMKLLGITDPEKIIGQSMYLWGDTPEIIGVIKDYHQESLKQAIKPLVLVYDTEVTDFYSIKIKSSSSLKEIIGAAKVKYGEAFPGNPFEYFFLDEHYSTQYQSDQRFGKVIGLFTLLAVIVACLGLLGLSSYLVSQRTKEIGIRKVLGATVAQIIVLVSREFILTILLSNSIAWPIAYFLLKDWLNGFAYRIDIGLLSFLIPGVCILLIAILTVAAQSIRAANTDPVENLRTE
ncbi:ABC transporter permease [Fulvivirgaceae bacterium PWU5]|uniref:ABC transporter permease n=1 Tax=Dawidia cretensis TaxID=2782350 RepID=A0AAP2E395_9BACT|nr:ABC transporter permease [Dawidia cretensis]MBT1711228.1 ABC transporter permease [Dawidia cretensis]